MFLAVKILLMFQFKHEGPGEFGAGCRNDAFPVVNEALRAIFPVLDSEAARILIEEKQ